MKYEAVIGIEVHVELKTETKIFCSCKNEFGAIPNTNVCPVCLGMPGCLPVLSGNAVSLAVRAGLALGCTINRVSWFDRKNYFYPDLPKGYQITQAEMPICSGGVVEIETPAGKKQIRLERIHLEEDAGRQLHRVEETLIDYNRAGVPLIEIVSRPDIETPAEAQAYLEKLRRTLSYIGVSDCKMNEGSLRCDVNVSVRPRGSEEYGIKCEIKNLNSIAYVGKALEYEIRRQTGMLEHGEVIEAETRRFDEDTMQTALMRKKESAVDYRYFTEPDLPPVELDDSFISQAQLMMGELSEDAAESLCREFGISRESAELITQSREMCEFFRIAARMTPYGEITANLFIGQVMPTFDSAERITPEQLSEVVSLFARGRIVSGSAKELIAIAAREGGSPCEIAGRMGLYKITSPEALMPHVTAAMADSPKSVVDYRRGKKSAVKQLVGMVMKSTSGRADPNLTLELLTKELEKTE